MKYILILVLVFVSQFIHSSFAGEMNDNVPVASVVSQARQFVEVNEDRVAQLVADEKIKLMQEEQRVKVAHHNQITKYVKELKEIEHKDEVEQIRRTHEAQREREQAEWEAKNPGVSKINEEKNKRAKDEQNARDILKRESDARILNMKRVTDEEVNAKRFQMDKETRKERYLLVAYMCFGVGVASFSMAARM
jgi:hypothetical protein